jgi:hypothetical protein
MIISRKILSNFQVRLPQNPVQKVSWFCNISVIITHNLLSYLFDYANCKHFRFAQRVIESRINTKVHCYFEFCKAYLIFFFFDESEVINDVNLLKPSRYYSYGCRVLNVLHTRLRHRSSNLNAGIFVHFVPQISYHRQIVKFQ